MATPRPRGRGMGRNSPTRPENIESTMRHIKALELRKAGLSFDRIAQELGYASAGAAHNAVRICLERSVQEPAKEVRQMEVARLDDMLLSIWPEVRKGHLGAQDRALKIMERRAKLLGLDAPTKIDFDDAPMPVVVNVQVVDASKPLEPQDQPQLPQDGQP